MLLLAITRHVVTSNETVLNVLYTIRVSLSLPIVNIPSATQLDHKEIQIEKPGLNRV